MKVTDDRMTFNGLRDWYFGLTSIQNKASYKDWNIQIGKFCKAFGDRAVGSLKVLDLEEHQVGRLDEGLKPASIDLEIQLAGQMVRKAVDNDIVSMDCLKPFTRLRRLSSNGQNARKRRMEIEEYVNIKPHLPIHADQVLTLLYYTGMRVTEPLKLTWDMIDWKTRFITLSAEITKTNTERRIPITPQLAKIMKAIPRDLRCPNVIVFRGRAIKQLGQAIVKKACEDAGYEHGQWKKEGLVLRDTRRSVSSFMERIGIPESHRKAIIGHKQSGMDVHYVHPSDEEVHESMAKYHSWLEEQIDLVQNLDRTVEKA
jgi:integrase